MVKIWKHKKTYFVRDYQLPNGETITLNNYWLEVTVPLYENNRLIGSEYGSWYLWTDNIRKAKKEIALMNVDRLEKLPKVLIYKGGQYA